MGRPSGFLARLTRVGDPAASRVRRPAFGHRGALSVQERKKLGAGDEHFPEARDAEGFELALPDAGADGRRGKLEVARRLLHAQEIPRACLVAVTLVTLARGHVLLSIPDNAAGASSQLTLSDLRTVGELARPRAQARSVGLEPGPQPQMPDTRPREHRLLLDGDGEAGHRDPGVQLSLRVHVLPIQADTAPGPFASPRGCQIVTGQVMLGQSAVPIGKAEPGDQRPVIRGGKRKGGNFSQKPLMSLRHTLSHENGRPIRRRAAIFTPDLRYTRGNVMLHQARSHCGSHRWDR